MSTYLLVHGAWHDGQVWSRVVPLLGAAGHRVLAPSLTGHGERRHLLGPEVDLATHIADVVHLIEAERLEDVVLVGHSYAGMVITGVAERVPDRIARLVYLDAMVPKDGESALDVIPSTQLLIDLAAASGQAWRIPPMPARGPAWFGVEDPADLRWLSTMVGDEAIGCFIQPLVVRSGAAAWIDRVHIHCVRGKAAGSSTREIAAVQPNGRPARVWELDASHDAMITAPDPLVELLLRSGRPSSSS